MDYPYQEALRASTLLSLTHSAVFTASNQSMAYFFTTTRVWEFGLGALLSIVLAKRANLLEGSRFPSAISWFGLALIVVALLTFGPETPFPSFTALLPVLGACLVIAAGSPASRLSPGPAMRLQSVQFIGDVSYGVYLWHWPLIVILPFVVARDLSTVEKIAVLIASVVLGWLSKVVVEDPIRAGRLFRGLRTRWVFVAVAGAMAVVTVVALPLALWRPTPVPNPAATPALCIGAEAMLDEGCGDHSSIPLVADLASFPADNPPADVLECEVSAQSESVHRCNFGTASAPHLAIIGDSHATRWVEAFRSVAADSGWATSTFLISGCPAFVDALVSTAWGYPETAENCRRLSEDAVAQVASDPDIDTVILTNRTRLYISPDGDPPGLTEPAVATTIERLKDAGKTVVVLKDPPEMNSIPPQGGGSAADCLSRAASPNECSLPRDATAFDDPVATAAEGTGTPIISLEDAFCDDSRCYSRIGGLVVYSDDNHVTRSFAASTRDMLAAQLDPFLIAAP